VSGTTAILRTILPLVGITFAIESVAVEDTANQREQYAPLPHGITSFGAAILDEVLYVYGGHKGRAHHYYQSGQVNELWKLNLGFPEQWEVVIKGPHLQGLAMVAHDGRLYRIGGFTALNKEDDEHDLRSVADFVRFDPQARQWESLTSLPEPRSSHDAVVVGDKLYVAGGWELGGDEPNWRSTAWVTDLSQKKITWEQLPSPPFQRRALALGHLDGKLYVIGGMRKEGGPTTRVDVFDPESGKWSSGPSLIVRQSGGEFDEEMEGFGSSAFCVGDRLYVSTYGGNLQCLARDAKQWHVATKLKYDRFFHRMLPFRQHLMLVGGASMLEGKRLNLEMVELSQLE